jgi:hypothetical protein
VNYHVDPGARTLDKKFRIRPPLDHFLPRSAYPYLAVSLSNLVPSCAQCNSSIKSSSDPLAVGLAHPQDPATTLDVRFSAVGSIPAIIKGTVDDIRIHLVATGLHSQAQVEAFYLQERYQWYRHEIKDLIERNAEHQSLPAGVRSLVSRELYVLGFLAAKASQRAIGLCLRDIYNELISGKVV